MGHGRTRHRGHRFREGVAPRGEGIDPGPLPPVTDAPSADALSVRGITVALGGVEVLRSVDVSVRSGSVLGVLGPSGAGKSTLFRVIAGEIAPREGTVAIDGRDVTRLSLWRRARVGLGYVPQTPSVLFDLTVEDNIRTFERAARVPSRPIGERAETVELDGRLQVRARDLSGGERRRLELLRALIAEPRLLVCDEPFAAGDPAHVGLLARLLRSHADRRGAVVLADHRIGDALGICDEALLLAEGRVQTRGSAADFRSHPAVRDRYLG